jgi:hypothetical protein
MDDLIVAVGRPLDDDAVRIALSRYSLRPDARGANYQNNRAGVSIYVDKGKVVAAFVYSEGCQGFAKYKGSLPAGLTFECDRQAARSILGDPEDSGDGDSAADGYTAWDRWVLSGCRLRAAYDSATGRVAYFGVIPGTAVQHDNFGVDDEPIDVDVIDIWLDELAKAQPQFGQLLQSTVDTIGQLPAIDDDGAAYTISHDDFWSAASYAESFVQTVIDHRRASAVVAESEAIKKNDDRLAAKKEAEATFWESVETWIETVGAARVKPEHLPDWLAKLDVPWNP